MQKSNLVLAIFVYNIVIRLYQFAIYLVSPFNHKARLWIDGRNGWQDSIKSIKFKKQKRVWFHCASLGEFEQARPVIEKWRALHEEDFIVLTFFSPSGYEIRKKYGCVDLIMYLPLDTRSNAQFFIETIKPDVALFVKYEFWFHYLQELKNRGIPSILFSSVFREKQIFFKWYGQFFRDLLGSFTKIFVQNESSRQLLKAISIESEVCFDTRFDRVNSIAQGRHLFNSIDKFKGNSKLVIAGSTWKADEELMIRFVNENVLVGCKFIIAPHNIDHHSIDTVISIIRKKTIRFSDLNNSNADTAEVVIVDNIGNLASLYAYADIAYVGGGFNSSVHNVLEAAVYGIPVLFGPNYQKSEEAKDLLVFPIDNYMSLKGPLIELTGDEERRTAVGLKNRKYVQDRLGGSARIVEYLNQLVNKKLTDF